MLYQMMLGETISFLVHTILPLIRKVIPQLLCFPGQKLTYSAKVTDYFGNLTSCLVDINLECRNYNFCEHVQIIIAFN